MVDSDTETYNSVNSSFHDAIEFENATTSPAEPTEDNTETHQVLEAASHQLRMATNYDAQTGTDDDGALEKACHNLKGYAFDENDLKFYFQQVELKMRKAGVKSSFTKLLVLSSILPEKVIDEVKSILRKEEDEYTEAQRPYKILKDQIIKIFKPLHLVNYSSLFFGGY